MAEMSGLMPTFDVNGGNNCNGDGWGNWGGALIGGAVGGAVGSAWGNRSYNNGNCCNSGCGDQYIMDSLTTMRSDVNSIGRDQLIQTTQLGQGICQGFGGVNASIERVGLSGQLTAAQGFSGLNTSILTSAMQGQLASKDAQFVGMLSAKDAEIQGMRNTYGLQTSIDNCCCTTNANIQAQGCQTREVLLAEGCATRATIDRQGQETRALISQLDRERLLRESAAKDAKIAQLEAQQFNTTLAAGSAQQCRNDLNAAMTNIIGHMAVINRTGTTTAAAAA